MKNFISTVVVSIMFALAASPAFSQLNQDKCDIGVQAANVVMASRQAGMPKDQLLSIVRNDSTATANDKDAFYQLIELAYKQPIFLGQSKQVMIDQFTRNISQLCQEGLRNLRTQ